MDLILVKPLPDGTKVLCYLIDTVINKGYCSDACKLISFQCANGSYQIHIVEFYQSYIPVSYSDSFRINIDIANMHRLTVRMMGESNALHNTNTLIHEIVCVSPPPYYLYCFEKS